MTFEEKPFAPPPLSLDIQANRRSRKWSPKELLGRLLWETVQVPLFQWTPRQLWGIRNSVLRVFGATIGTHVQIHPTVRIAIPWNLTIEDNVAVGDCAVLYSLGKIRIGARACISQYAHICAGTHDASLEDMPLLKQPIDIGEGVWVCANAFVGPNTKIGDYAIVGACAVVMKDIPNGSKVVGNPGRIIGLRKKLDSNDQ